MHVIWTFLKKKKIMHVMKKNLHVVNDFFLLFLSMHVMNVCKEKKGKMQLGRVFILFYGCYEFMERIEGKKERCNVMNKFFFAFLYMW